ncbi:hypothetical protein PASE110613_17835 [Paenibacillus sediminis]|uniref:Fe-S cluster biosynthesis and repair protein YggX n=1 Tax=Paenibacillus sediminis TaxID=664909 RepID=A0ABS4H8J7_9BACL|nr:hypothetical protein [Paenibacillus sediminis]MBP1938682.1 Fe-S cluster biosynthesis and repair protein YggX [Paenibacillus sediminis]
MKSLITLLIIAILVTLLLGCSKDNKSQFLGNWEADQASQQEGSNDLLGHFNYLKISSSNINLRNFHNEIGIESGETVKVFDEIDKNLAYEWKSKDQIIINNKLYEIEVSKRELIIKNDKIEIHYNKKK